jgi:hypothetical protein
MHREGNKMQHKSPLKSLFFVPVTAITATFMVPTASAQMEYMAEAMHPEYMSRDLVVFAEGLNLDDTQEVIVEAMFDSYEDDFEFGWASTQERLNKVAEDLKKNPPTSTKETLEPVLNALGDWLQEKRLLDQGLLENVNAILVADQKELWPGFTQRLYREKHTNRGRLSGESVDLFLIVRDSQLSPIAESIIETNLIEYATALDNAMRTRDTILRGNPKKLFDNILSGNADRPPALVDSLIRARIEVRDLNDQYIDFISSTLSDIDGENFRNRALKRGYTRIYRRTPAQRIFRQAAENESYPAEITALILQLEAAYLQELGSINYKLLTLTRKHEPEVHRNRELAGQVRKNGGTPLKLVDPTREVFKQREELGKRYIELLRGILSPDEFIELDGARRWIPRSELPDSAPGLPPSGALGGDLTLDARNGTGIEKGKGGKGKGKGKPKVPNTNRGFGKPGR